MDNYDFIEYCEHEDFIVYVDDPSVYEDSEEEEEFFADDDSYLDEDDYFVDDRGVIREIDIRELTDEY